MSGRSSQRGAQPGAPIDWTHGVGKLTVGQCGAVLLAASAISKLDEVLAPEAVVTALAATQRAVAAVTGIDLARLDVLPLDQFIDGTVAVAEVLMRENVTYLAGPVTEAFARLTRTAEAAISAAQPAA